MKRKTPEKRGRPPREPERLAMNVEQVPEWFERVVEAEHKADETSEKCFEVGEGVEDVLGE